MKVGYHTHIWHEKAFQGVNVWFRHAAIAFSEKRLTVYLFGLRLINWTAR